MVRRLRDNGLGLFFGLLFLLSLAGQAVAGAAQYDERQRQAGLPEIGVVQYVLTADFAADVAENWQSEYLQFLLFILATVWLVQRGSPESKRLDERGRESDEDQLLGRHVRKDSPPWARAGGWRTRVFSHSLALTMGAIWFVSWLAQSIAGWSAYSEEQLQDQGSPVTYLEYLGRPDFWARTFQNWQSEFLAVGSMVVLSIYLRERGSPESKPVGAPHAETADTG